jgi:hypothetical protein
LLLFRLSLWSDRGLWDAELDLQVHGRGEAQDGVSLVREIARTATVLLGVLVRHGVEELEEWHGTAFARTDEIGAMGACTHTFRHDSRLTCFTRVNGYARVNHIDHLGSSVTCPPEEVFRHHQPRWK